MDFQTVETVTIRQAGDLLRQAADIYFQKDGRGRYQMDPRRARPLCLMGPAGIGKTEIVAQVAEEKGLAFLSYSITHHTRQSLLGLPCLKERQVEGRTVTVTDYTMSEIIAAIHQTMAETGKEEGILFLDEFNCASPTLRPILLQLLQSKRFGAFPIPEGWMLVVAGNPGGYNSSVMGLDAVTADRLRMLWLRADYGVWKDYILPKGVHPTVLSYLDQHPEHFSLFAQEEGGAALVTPRAWEDLSVMLTCNEAHGYPVDEAFVGQYIQSAKVARTFTAYYTQGSHALIHETVRRLEADEGLDDLWPQLQVFPIQTQWALVSQLVSAGKRLCREAVRQDGDVAALHMTLKAALACPDGPIPFLQAHLAAPVEEDEALSSPLAGRFIQDYLAQAIRDPKGERLRAAFRDGPAARLTQSIDQAAALLDRSALFCRDCFGKGPQLEFLLNTLSQDFDCGWVIAQREVPALRAVGQAAS